MGDLKKWHIVLFVVAIAGLGVSLALSLRSNEPAGMADTLYLADVQTGELFSISIRNRSTIVPSRNPATGQRTLYPVFKDDEGRWLLREKYRSAIPEDLKTDAIISNDTGEVRVAGDSIKRL